jgi:glucose/arabinose dehydrogenase
MKIQKIHKVSLLGVLAGGFLLGLAWYLGAFQYQVVPEGETISVADEEEASLEAEKAKSREVQNFRAVSLVQGLEVPWGAVFTSTERLLVTERGGQVRVVTNGALQAQPLHVFSQVQSKSEEGLMGIALDPHYQDNKLVYFAYAYQQAELKVKVVRLTDTGTALVNEQVVIDNIPAAKYHAGTRIAFGPDQKLYITTGDATNKKTPQDLKSLGGKILRMNSDGSIPEDNPFEGSPVYTYGHRNSQGLTWDTVTGEMYATEHGPSLFDGPAGGDEINHIIPGSNYGWPLVSHKEKLDEAEEPMLLFTPAVAPGGMTFVKGDRFSSLTNTLLFAGLKGEGLYRVVLKETDPGKVKEYQKLAGINVGRIRDVFESSTGEIYFLTSNKDGRGQPKAGDDILYRLELAE